MKLKKLLVIGVLLLTQGSVLSLAAGAPSLLFEGWFQVLLGSKKVGFLVERYEFKDSKFTVTTYLKTNADGSNVTESLKGVSANNLTPITYQYTSKVGDKIKLIDATVKNDLMTLNIDDGSKKSVSSKRIKKGTFLSSMLIYLILSQKNGLKIGNDFKYNAIAEEEGTAYTGSLLVKNEEPVRNKPAIRLINEFKGEKFITWVTSRGETLLVRQPAQNIDVRFAETRAEATEGFTVNNKDLELLFGKVPGDSGSPSKTKTSTPAKKLEPTLEPPSETPEAPGEKKPQALPSQAPIEIKGVPPPKNDP